MIIQKDKSKVLTEIFQRQLTNFENKWNVMLDFKSGYILSKDGKIKPTTRLTNDPLYLEDRKNIMEMLENQIGLSFELNDTPKEHFSEMFINSPSNGLEDWEEMYEEILGKIKLNTRKDFANLIKSQAYTKGVEVGVAAGQFTKYLLDNTPQAFSMTMVDPFTNDNIDFKFPVDVAAKYNENHIKSGRCQIKVMKSLDAAPLFEDNSLDFIYIDGLHTDCAKDIAAWFPKLKEKGCIAGHDYHKKWQLEVYNAVNEFAEKTGLELKITGFDGAKDDGMEESVPSWFFIKE